MPRWKILVMLAVNPPALLLLTLLMNIKSPHLKGFTLVELVIAMTIVAVLATIGFATFSSILKNNRDQERIKDLNSVKQALELYRSNNHSYPASLDLSCLSSASLIDSTKVYMEVLPKDPIC